MSLPQPSMPPENRGDAELVRSVLLGQRDDYRWLVQRYEARLYRYAVGMVRDADSAADLVQDALVKAYASLASCRDADRFGAWVFRIVRNRCHDYLKEHRRRDVSLDGHGDIADGRSAVESDVARREFGDIVASALERLPDTHREAFLLKHVEDLSYEEISSMLDVGISALKMRVARSRDFLRDVLRESGYPSGSGM